MRAFERVAKVRRGSLRERGFSEIGFRGWRKCGEEVCARGVRSFEEMPLRFADDGCSTHAMLIRLKRKALFSLYL